MALNRIQRDGIEDSAIDTSKILDGILGTVDITNDTLTNAKFSNSAAIPTSKLSGLATSATTDTTNATNITSGSLATARVNVGTTAGKILQVDGSGNLPAIDGSLLTGIVSFTKSASDPAIDTNPSAGVGAEWVNTTSGEVYLCTDATAGANVWTNVGPGTGNVEPIPGYQGDAYGYATGGYNQYGSPLYHNEIQKYSFTSDANGTDVANLVAGNNAQGGHSSTTHGYNCGGNSHTGPNWTTDSIIEKFQFSNDADSVDTTADLFDPRIEIGTTQSDTHGYQQGGQNEPGGTTAQTDTISKFPFASSANGTDVGNLTVDIASGSGLGKARCGGCSSATHGYALGGLTWHAPAGPVINYALNAIERYSFASDGDGADVGNLTQIVAVAYGCSSSETHGYLCGGYVYGGVNNSPVGGYTNVIEKVAYASSSNATDVGDATISRGSQMASTSTTHGYVAGGYNSWPTQLNVIEKYSFTTDGNATDVGDLAVATNIGASNVQV